MPNAPTIESRCFAIGQQVFKVPTLHFLSGNYWTTRLMELATKDPRVKTQLFRFVDVLPVLKTDIQKKAHLIEYLSAPQGSLSWPFVLRMTTFLLRIPVVDTIVLKIADLQIKRMAKNFIVGTDLKTALPKIIQRRENRNLAFTVDLLGEAVLSDREADEHYAKYLELIEGLGSKKWNSVPLLDQSFLGPIPPVNVSIKISALDCRMDPMAFESSLERLEKRLIPIMEAAQKSKVFLNFDMEQYSLKDLTRALFKKLILSPRFKSYRYFGIVVQAYLKDAASDIADWIEVAKERGNPFSIRLVKGAYWDYETIVADQNGWEAPVFEKKIESDRSYEHCTRLLMDAYPFIEVAIASHNVRSISHAIAYAEEKKIPKNAFEIQMLYGMAEPFKDSLVKMGIRVREYDPIGEMIPGLSYLVRRLLENTSNDSFLKQSFMDKTGIRDLLKKP